MTDTQTLFLAWQDKAWTRGWFPIGRLDVVMQTPLYRFRYIGGAITARQKTGFEPLYDFPDFERSYESSELFPLFKNRVLTARRPDFSEYLRQLDLPVDLPEEESRVEILSVDGGYRATDSFEVFPKIERREDGTFRCRFFLHGWRYMNEEAQRRVESLSPGDTLHVAIELTNPTAREPVQIQTEDRYVIGWAPNYLVADFLRAIAKAPQSHSAKVVRVNPAPAPSKQRLLLEFRGHFPDNPPMTDGEFKPLTE